MGILSWQWARLGELSLDAQYELHEFRGAVGSLGQGIGYLDTDSEDREGYHLLGWEEGNLVAYLRVQDEGKELTLDRMGVRRADLWPALIREALEEMGRSYRGRSITLQVDPQLEGTCQAMGFVAVSSPFNLEGRPHIEMTSRPRG
ncbi:MAG: hypothetical protein AB7F31_03370 [Parachlamydiales bacterium]